MIPGLNTNIELGDRRWHVQTELPPGEPPIFRTQVFHEGVVVSTTSTPAPEDASLTDLLRTQRRAHAAAIAALREAYNHA